MAAAGEDTPIVCSFCRKPTSEVGTMVAGAGVYICDACVSLCAEIIASKQSDAPRVADWDERISDDDLLGLLPQMVAAGAQVDRQLARAVTRARERGITWTRIGGSLGMTRQSAWERFSGEE
jgi:ATP-dependent protease Clp ATPase subunit